jgi:hypothetical protein
MPYLTEKQIHTIATKTMSSYHGDLPLVEGAIGTLYAGKQFGWKVLYLVHDKKTLKKYEDILEIKFREAFPDLGPRAEHSHAYRLSLKVSNFWKAVKGEIKGIRSPSISPK